MCKLLGTNNVMVRRHSQMVELSKFAAASLGATQKDGFGFALQHQKGLYLEKYLSPDSCKGMGIVASDLKKIPHALKIAMKQDRDYFYSGEYPETDDIKGAFISHGRTATCDKNIINTHPFQGMDKRKGKWTIAHNGVVDCIGEKLETVSSCDSEHILNCFTKLDGVNSLKHHISGYAAILGINPRGEMIAFRDNTAPLYVSIIEGFNVFTLATDPSHAEAFNELICKFNKIKKSRITDSYLIEPYNFLTFHKNGEITNLEFDSFPRYASNSQAVKTSLGSAGYKGHWSSSPSYTERQYPYVRDSYSSDAWGLDYDEPTKSVDSLKDTKALTDDPALLDAIEQGELTVKDLADIAGESGADKEQLELLENQIANKIKRDSKNRPWKDQK